MTLITNERDAYKTQLDEATSTLSKQESEKASLFSEEAEALRKSISRRDEEVRGSPQNFPCPLHSTTLTAWNHFILHTLLHFFTDATTDC